MSTILSICAERVLRVAANSQRRCTLALGAAAAAALALAWSPTASAQIFNQVIVFGDSNVDSGYYKALSNPGGNSSYNADWPTAVADGAGAPTTNPGLENSQMLAAFFELTANPSNTAGGTNYATSGGKNVTVNSSQTGGFTAAVPTVTQIANYLAANDGVANGNALYLIHSGDNDAKYAAGETGNGPYPADPDSYMATAAQDLANAIQTLYSAGARHFIVSGLEYDYPNSDPTLRALKLLYTNDLWSDLTTLNVPFYQADIDKVRRAISTHPSQYGFTSITSTAGTVACTQPTGVTTAWALLCSSNPSSPSTWVSPTAPQTDLFADDQHLGTAGQQLMANYLYRLVVPPTVTHSFSGDGMSDILWRNASSSDTAIWFLSDGQFSSGGDLGVVPSTWSIVGQRDFNNDGRSDILWQDSSGDIALWLMNGAALSSGISLGNIGTQWTVAGTGDFNADGNGDILWRNTSTGDTAIWFMSNGQFSSGVDLGTVPLTWQVVGIGDFNGDGASDILWKDSSGNVAIWLMNGSTLSSGVSLGNVGTTWSAVGTGDFNGDGTSDILWRDTSGNVAIWLIANAALSSGASLGNIPTTWSVAETGDFNGDGKSDILWLDSSGNLAVWLMNGTSLSSGVSLGSVGTSWQAQGHNAD